MNPGEHEDVLDACVVGLKDETWGERVVAAVVLRQGATIDGLQSHVQAHLASFKRPQAFHVTDELPRTSTGKLLRRNVIPILEELGL